MTSELLKWFKGPESLILGHHETALTTYLLALDVIERGVPGDLVECGVFAGSECAVMAKALMETRSQGRRVHLFDGFQGVPPCGPEDLEWVAETKEPWGAKCSQVEVAANMVRWGIPSELLVWHPGWFADTLPSLEIGPISLLRLDADIYSSTQVCMKHLYPLLSRGSWLIVDDYHLSGCRKAIHEAVGFIQPAQPGYFQKLPMAQE